MALVVHFMEEVARSSARASWSTAAFFTLGPCRFCNSATNSRKALAISANVTGHFGHRDR